MKEVDASITALQLIQQTCNGAKLIKCTENKHNKKVSLVALSITQRLHGNIILYVFTSL